MIADRYYYNHLPAEEKKIYTILYKGVTGLEKEIYCPHTVTPDAVQRIFHAITHDNPNLYYFNQSNMGVGATAFGTVFLPQYFCTKEQIEIYNGRISECVNRIVGELDLQNCSELEKEKRIHDYLCLNTVYDHEALNTNSINRIVAAHSIIGVFAKQRAVCEGIAKATKLLLNTVNVGCIVVSGKASLEQMSEHSWNIVKIAGQAYQLDMTWDVSNTQNGLINYDYFNLMDEDISKDHFEYSDVPSCTAIEANYFIMNGLYFKNMRQVEKYLLRGIKKGQLSFYFKIAEDGHKMVDIIKATRSFVLTEMTNREVHASVSASFKEAQRTGRVTIEPIV